MTTLSLAHSRVSAGFWEALLDGVPKGASPAIEVIHREKPLADLQLTETGGRWTARAPIPAGVLSDGVQTFLVRDSATGDQIGAFSIVTGAPADGDLRVEIDLLRAELDMLKKAFRRHCVETGQG